MPQLHPIFTQAHATRLMIRKLTLGLSLVSGLALSTGCSEDSTDYSASYNSGPSLSAPATSDSYDVDWYGNEMAGGEMSAGDPSSPGAIVDDVELTYNAEEIAAEDNKLTFAVDVDTASYTIARSYLERDELPPKQVIRVEEFINFFDYQDAPPESLEESPFAVHLDAAKSPFGAGKTLLRIGIKGFEVADADRPATNLVFLIDTSGSMGDSIDLVRQSLGLLLDSLNPTDTIALVTYAGNSRIALRPTPASDREQILSAMRSLTTGGSTNGAGGINSAYTLAEDAFKSGGLNRVVLCTDGDFNVGVTGSDLYDLIEEKRESGITLSVLGFGGRYNDAQMEQLADRGNGNYTFIDSLREAERALVDRLTATLMVIAKDVKVQLEVNPTLVKTYRLLGYENRAIADQDFRNDQVDAGEIGAGHTVTALVELELYPEGERPSLQELNVQLEGEVSDQADLAVEPEGEVDPEAAPEETSEEGVDPQAEVEEVTPEERAPLVIDPIFGSEEAPLALLRLRNKTPEASAEDPAVERVHVINESDIRSDAKQASAALRFSAAVAEFAEILRESPYVEEIDFDLIIELAENARVEDDHWASEFIDLVRVAKQIITVQAN